MINKIEQLVREYIVKYGKKPNIIILPIKDYAMLIADPKASAYICHDCYRNRDTIFGLEIHYVEQGEIQVYKEVYYEIH